MNFCDFETKVCREANRQTDKMVNKGSAPTDKGRTRGQTDKIKLSHGKIQNAELLSIFGTDVTIILIQNLSFSFLLCDFERRESSNFDLKAMKKSCAIF